jgi:hypothetical protein
MRLRGKLLIGVAVVLAIGFLGMAAYGLWMVFSGEGTGHVLWTRLAEAPEGAPEMAAANFTDDFHASLAAAAPGEGGLLLTRSHNGFWSDVRAAGAVETQDECLAVKLRGIPVEFCEGPLI